MKILTRRLTAKEMMDLNVASYIFVNARLLKQVVVPIALLLCIMIAASAWGHHRAYLASQRQPSMADDK